jgi:hypothetical protein
VKKLQDRNDGLQQELRKVRNDLTKGEAGILRLVPEAGRGGLGKGLKPCYVECTAEGLLLHPGKRHISLSEIHDTVFREYVENVKSMSDSCMEFLIRPDGVKTFKSIRAYIDSQDVKYGYLPLPGAGEIED